eukprot:TRINITY_DN20877_c0_g1_i1.p1 TRINITY_DN20877_c0_g1~~TRINITY_DN20877_c0_g1_i1.p1  ORF type:complete len:231 (+),score=48.41 TRINITY_DN20877_c0_g1_i1:62-754(+)
MCATPKPSAPDSPAHGARTTVAGQLVGRYRAESSWWSGVLEPLEMGEENFCLRWTDRELTGWWEVEGMLLVLHVTLDYHEGGELSPTDPPQGAQTPKTRRHSQSAPPSRGKGGTGPEGEGSWEGCLEMDEKASDDDKDEDEDDEEEQWSSRKGKNSRPGVTATWSNVTNESEKEVLFDLEYTVSPIDSESGKMWQLMKIESEEERVEREAIESKRGTPLVEYHRLVGPLH